ncbi:MAG: CheR family methyltransferase, partial [Candidatus Omnitrophota bacterium]
FSVEIIATDIDRTSLEIAQKGIYRKDNLKNVSQEYLEKYFETIDKNIVSVKKEIRQMVHFRQHDMIQDQPPCTGIDIIFCRNVFIYFMRSLQEQLIMTFYNTLKDKRYLILGLVESLLGEARTIFEEIDDEHRIYRKMSKIPH